MSIIQPDKVSPREIKVEDVVNQIKRINLGLYRDITEKHTMGFKMVWNNPNFTPQEIINAFGADVIALFTLSAGLQQILKNADPDYKVLVPPYEVSITKDGVVVGKKIDA